MQLAEYIKEDLRRRIQSGVGIPSKLTLANLSEHYNVSLTPVRAAINDLLADEVLLKQENGRLQVNPHQVGTQSHASPVAGPPQPKDWDEKLIYEVMLASLTRMPVYLREEAIAQKYHAGRSIIRQSFARLAGAGLLDHVPRCGWLARPVRRTEVRAYLEVRQALELKALSLAQPDLSKTELQDMLAGNIAAGKGQPDRLDNRLHQYLIDKSGNCYLQDFFHQPVAKYYTALFNHAAPEASVVSDMANQHRRILTALIAKKWSVASQALAEHIQAQEPVLEQLFDQLDSEE